MSAPPRLHIVILAAGIGSRMRSDTPKVLHRLAGCPLLQWVIQAARPLGPEVIHVIYGHHRDQLQTYFNTEKPHWIHQEQQLGTAHALAQALPHIPDEAQILVLAGDVPLIQTSTLASLIALTAPNELGLLLAEPLQPTGYGRVLRNIKAEVIDIVEEKDATPEQRLIREIYTGVCLAQAATFKQMLPLIQTNNAQKEYYLTQVVSLASQRGLPIKTLTVNNEMETQGVNTRQQLSELERYWQRQQAYQLMEQGVCILDPNRIDIRGRLNAEPDVVIDINTVFEGEVTLKKGCRIGPNCVLKNVTVDENAEILSHSVIEESIIGANSSVGPFARLRPGTILAEACKIGNFVETKKAQFGPHSKASHLSYLGDVQLGKDVNVGAGTITCNYDGANKHETIIEDGAFIGSGTQLIAPVRVGENATIGAGTTLRANAPANALTLSAKEQKTLTNWKRPRKNRSQHD